MYQDESDCNRNQKGDHQAIHPEFRQAWKIMHTIGGCKAKPYWEKNAFEQEQAVIDSEMAGDGNDHGASPTNPKTRQENFMARHKEVDFSG